MQLLLRNMMLRYLTFLISFHLHILHKTINNITKGTADIVHFMLFDVVQLNMGAQ